MNCFHPIRLKNPNYGINKETELYILVPCGRCELCKLTVAKEWCTRLELEWKYSESSYFVTLTYTDDHLPFDVCTFSDATREPVFAPVVSKRDCQLFLKRLRKSFPESEIRYFLVSEYGPTTFRPHYHAIVFGLPLVYGSDLVGLVKLRQKVESCWNNGEVRLDPVTFGRISYCTMYVCSVANLPSYLPPPFRLMSRRPGIGSSYLLDKDRISWHRDNLFNFYPDGKFKKRLPRFLKDKIFDDDMKEQIRESDMVKFHDITERFGFHYNDSTYYEHMDSTFDSVARFKDKFYNRFVKKRKNI